MLFRRTYSHGLPVPTRQTPGSAGYDLATDSPLAIKPGGTFVASTGWSVALPWGTCGFIRGRSGLAFNSQVIAFEGTIDEDYRGELKVLLFNMSDTIYVAKAGARIAQLVVVPYTTAPWSEVDEFPRTRFSPRGGFGSTGE